MGILARLGQRASSLLCEEVQAGSLNSETAKMAVLHFSDSL